MYKIIFLTLLSAIYVNCDGWLEKCPTVEPIKEIDISKINGLWYIVRRSDSQDNKNKCERISFNQVDWYTTNSTYTFIDQDGILNSYESVNVMNPQTPYEITSVFPNNNPLIKSWFGEVSYQILDTDYINYALVYSCTKQFFGFWTNEVITVVSRNNTRLDYHTLYRVNSIIKAFDYKGAELIDMNQQSPLCNF